MSFSTADHRRGPSARGHEQSLKCVYGCGRPAEFGDDTCTECLLLEEEEEKALRFEDDRFAD